MAHHEEPRAFHTRAHRQHGELEIGVTQAVGHIQQKESLHVVDIAPVPNFIKTWERKRPTWLMEMIAETWGVFCYTYAGVGATAALVITSAAQEENLGGLLNVAIAYGFGIAFAIITAASTSGGHFNPCVTIAFCLFRGFPLRKVPRYIFAQCLGAFIASICVWGQYHRELGLITTALKAAGKEAQIFSSSGPAGVIAIFPAAGASMGRVFLNEFIVDFFVTGVRSLFKIVIWACLDPANPFVSAASVPFAIGMAYTAMIIGYVPGTIATNAARDFGARCAAAAIWGKGAFPSPYSAISALTNIPAMLLAVCLEAAIRAVMSSAESVTATTSRTLAGIPSRSVSGATSFPGVITNTFIIPSATNGGNNGGDNGNNNFNSGGGVNTVSCGIVIRSFVLRRRFHRRVEEAIAAGVLLPGQADIDMGPGGGIGAFRRPIGEKPKMWQVWIDTNGSHTYPSASSEWSKIQPLAATQISEVIPETPALPKAGLTQQEAPVEASFLDRLGLHSIFRRDRPRTRAAPSINPTPSSPDVPLPTLGYSTPTPHGSAQTNKANPSPDGDRSVQVAVFVTMPDPARPRYVPGAPSSPVDENGVKGKQRSFELPSASTDEHEIPEICIGISQAQVAREPNNTPSQDQTPSAPKP
ncbi:hypothetical protein FRC11_002178 [Ceratobasidium sp. 423]|nr:hypothetical protein FRC11_002178 [Ceratobasidium sp. 423]